MIDDAQRLVQHGRGDGRADEHALLVDLVDVRERLVRPQVEDEEVDPGLAERLAVLLGEQARVLVAVLDERVHRLADASGALAGRHARPLGERGAGRDHGVDGVLPGRRCRRADEGVRVRRVEDVDDTVAVTASPVDEQLRPDGACDRQ